MDQDPSERRARLLGMKLVTLVREHLGAIADDVEISPVPFPGGAALITGSSSWILVEDRPERSLGGAIVWSVRNGADELHLIAEESTGLLARRAAQFRVPISIWHADGRTLLPAVPEPLEPAAAPPPGHLELTALIEQGGASARIEHGVLAGEVLGLEVCRVVTDENTGEARLDVGIGAHDREAFAMLHGAIPTIEALSGVVDAVRPHRENDASPHPLNRLAVERAIRDRAILDPASVDAVELSPAPPPIPRPNLKDAVPCVAEGTATDGRSLVAVFSSGVDLDVVPFAADARLALHADDPQVVDLAIVVPERDRLPVTVMLADLLQAPARVVAWQG